MKSPLSLYVVFHPQSEECRTLAGHLHDWFRLKEDDGEGTEAGLPIWFRAHLNGGRISPEVAWDDSTLNLLIILVDDRMVADAAWRSAVERLVAEGERKEEEKAAKRCLVLPAAVDWSAFRLSFLFGERNRIPAGDPAPAEEPTTDAGARAARERRIRLRARILRRAVTEAATRQLRCPADAELPPPLQVFLSHAKQDGTEIALALRDGLADYGQLKTWYDANELPPGYHWDSPMRSAAKSNTAALISVVTDSYPTRYWCRQEVSLARQPRDITPKGVGAAISAWTVQPAVALVRSQSRWSRPLAQLVQVPHVGWITESAARPGETEQEEKERRDRDRLAIRARVEDVVDRVVLEALLVEFYRRYAILLANELKDVVDQQIVLVTWVPDPWSLVHLLGPLPLTGRPLVLAYPGHGLRTAERRELSELCNALNGQGLPTGQPEEGQPEEKQREEGRPRAGGPKPRLISQERLSERDLHTPLPRLKIALSAGGEAADLEPAGVSPRHLDDLMTRLSRRLLESNCKLHYGGTLANQSANLTGALIETARGWDREADASGKQKTGTATAEDLNHPPFVNYSPWPHYRHISARQKAELTGICHFVQVDPLDAPPVPAAAAKTNENPQHARAGAHALSRMRDLCTERTDLRIVFGGKIHGWEGWLPGIAEEVAISIAHGKLPLIAGGFGGCAGELATFLWDPSSPWPSSLGYEAAAKNPKSGPLMRLDEAFAGKRFVWMKEQLALYREQLHGQKPWPFAHVSRERVRMLLHCGSPAGMLNCVLHILSEWT